MAKTQEQLAAELNPQEKIPGVDPVFDILARILVGNTEDEAITQAREQFPQMNPGPQNAGVDVAGRTGQHFLNSQEFMNRYGAGPQAPIAFLASQLGGLGIEGIEGMKSANRNIDSRQDSLIDLISNALGATTGMLPQDLQGGAGQLSASTLNLLQRRMAEDNIDPLNFLPQAMQDPALSFITGQSPWDYMTQGPPPRSNKPEELEQMQPGMTTHPWEVGPRPIHGMGQMVEDILTMFQ